MIKETILLVDDDESVLSMLARSLEANYHILVASNGTAAVKVYEQHGQAIAALVTAVKMPRPDGTTLAEWVRHINPTLPIILMSGSMAGDRISQLLRRPGIAFLAKPFSPIELVKLLNNLGVVSASSSNSEIVR